ncbi:glycosyltransferase, partial [Gluconobacter kondonii]
NAKILRFEGNIGFIRSCNEAVKFICSPYILFLNNDTEIKWGSIQSAIKRFDNEIKIGVIGGKIIRTNGL